MKRKTLGLAFTGLFFLAMVGCGGTGSHASSTQNDLKQIGLAYHDFNDKNKRGPKDADEFKPFLDKENKDLYPKFKDGTYVFNWNVGMLDMSPAQEILSYHKEVPDKGGYALFGDGSARKLSADEFKNAKQAKPKG